MKQCAYCNLDFFPKSKNQKYCNPECCRKATNKKIMEKYYENKERLNGKVRLCIQCKCKLSRYNPYDICLLCEKRNKRTNEKLFLEALSFVAKQTK